ncbi:hypothetical protein [Iodobacter fluviatilis]|uniref:Uncharacterized protein n=1 Tax=Iodobacter fluviatilis TaxID=537 RepID=A0A377Q647_9NEIS|nr:hypothetical protein [Iodobacter fluviatilis]TCU86907.1 hypothetical protein EV682_10532 [Iodobacter fluviatilis]STQ90238.1 Uncharacterised protein [Iodobacter fluviatilis]
MKKIVFFLIFSIYSICVQAENTNVFCAAADGDYWYWAKDKNENVVQVSGTWERALPSNGTYFYYFSISEESFNNIRKLCRQGEHTQPADNKYSKWHIFQITKPDQSNYFAPGRYTDLIDLNSSFQLRV